MLLIHKWLHREIHQDSDIFRQPAGIIAKNCLDARFHAPTARLNCPIANPVSTRIQQAVSVDEIQF